jgi:hypothetical protein
MIATTKKGTREAVSAEHRARALVVDPEQDGIEDGFLRIVTVPWPSQLADLAEAALREIGQNGNQLPLLYVNGAFEVSPAVRCKARRPSGDLPTATGLAAYQVALAGGNVTRQQWAARAVWRENESRRQADQEG